MGGRERAKEPVEECLNLLSFSRSSHREHTTNCPRRHLVLLLFVLGLWQNRDDGRLWMSAEPQAHRVENHSTFDWLLAFNCCHRRARAHNNKHPVANGVLRRQEVFVSRRRSRIHGISSERIEEWKKHSRKKRGRSVSGKLKQKWHFPDTESKIK